MVLSIIFLEDKHKMLLHLSILYEYQQFFQHRICFSIQPPDYSDPWPRLAHLSRLFLIRLFNKINRRNLIQTSKFKCSFRWRCHVSFKVLTRISRMILQVFDVPSHFQEFPVWNYFDFLFEEMGYSCICINMKKYLVCQAMTMNIRNFRSPSEAHAWVLP